ncbi:MarR family winged helix-turn-helix transcriptional regulator [Aggregatilinea lenta]|uniref:MarR family winged helix-turn-helix transcriptional regulator n=1 Tax=Aggregatilinea lenta TaxID=913108 RepID=UPI000E5AC360|nr:MarR family transcriptional regulator [Aggregatilinea lenta]
MIDRVQRKVARQYRTSILGWLHMVRVHSRISRGEQALLAEYGLTGAQFDVLSHLASEPGLNQQMLAGRLLVTKGNVAGLIDRLETAGFVERRDDPEDRRTHRLYLTPAGECAFDAAAPVLEAHIDSRLEVLNPAEQATLLVLLAKLDRALRKEKEEC